MPNFPFDPFAFRQKPIGDDSSLFVPSFARDRETPVPAAFGAMSDGQGNPPEDSRSTAQSPLRPVMKFVQSAYQHIIRELGSQPFVAEQGGMLIGPEEEEELVTHFVPDRHGRATAASFTLDAEGLNSTLRRIKRSGLTCTGLVHSHPPRISTVSPGDLIYLQKIFASPKNGSARQILFPIVCNGRLYPYVIDSADPSRVLFAELVLV